MEMEEVDAFLASYNEYYFKSLKLTKKQQEAARKRAAKEGFFGSPADAEVAFDEDAESAVVFFNPNCGIEIFPHMNSAFPETENRFYEEEFRDEDFMELMYDKEYSKEIVEYCYENHRDQYAFLRKSKMLMNPQNFDFLLVSPRKKTIGPNRK